MGEAKHTPGPWRYEKADAESGWSFEIIGTEPKGGLTVDEHVLAGVLFTAYGSIPIRDGEANARLIAAAPDLLDACRALFAHYDRCSADAFVVVPEDLCDRLRAAVAAAEPTD